MTSAGRRGERAVADDSVRLRAARPGSRRASSSRRAATHPRRPARGACRRPRARQTPRRHSRPPRTPPRAAANEHVGTGRTLGPRRPQQSRPLPRHGRTERRTPSHRAARRCRAEGTTALHAISPRPARSGASTQIAASRRLRHHQKAHAARSTAVAATAPLDPTIPAASKTRNAEILLARGDHIRDTRLEARLARRPPDECPERGKRSGARDRGHGQALSRHAALDRAHRD
jgi:hypothetical protein